ncbi:peptidase [Sphaerisporangium rufum]|uniref:Peptidase n=1 Tax=Sphaerisporangium rufum TaxID=1381558 RepID=A0A919R970_9ACTN|nr:S8 family serine peptidase [Sphaerisporangium rufum]GII81724.1 peptidase [Sphaerisporangium rufum]
MPRWMAVAVAAAALGGAGVTAPATAAHADTGPAGRSAPATPAPRGLAATPADTFDITLVTGDRVRVTALPGGRRTATVTPAPRRNGRVPAFQTLNTGHGMSVIPDDVAALVPHHLDSALFDLTALAEQGGADSARGTIPLIVTGAASTASTTSTTSGAPPAIPAARPTRRLESIGGAAVTVDKAHATELGAALATLARAETRRDRSPTAAGPLAGVGKIWLDRRVRAVLDHSVPQISAPAAWAAGYDGSGTTVAVLDTGVDAAHADLAGKVADARDFTGGADPVDHFGHGTHVAGIIAGSGAASGGRLKGVAPGATLLNGKVLGDDGYGETSGIIDGLEWAVTEKRADVVNLSLGGDEPGGPLTAAVEELGGRYGTLVVAAAGNGGCDRCVAGPGDAAAALTVGAVDRDDRLAEFSSRGPILRDMSVKPDVTAPGVAIVSARAAGTSPDTPVGDSYAAMSGTSMATPHVAGAAALLRQARPGIRPAELKALVMSTADRQDGTSVDAQGTGRVNVAAALAGPVVPAAGGLHFGDVVTDGDPMTRQITYRNVTDVPVALSLTATGTLTVSPPALTVPAGGTAGVTVTLDPTRVEPGPLREELIAVPARGDSIRTLLTGRVDEPRVELRVRGIGRDGRPARGGFSALDLDRGDVTGRVLPGDPAEPCSAEPDGPGTCVLVHRGTYSVLGHLYTMPPWQESTAEDTPLHVSLVGDPQMRIDRDTEIVLDARKAVEVRVRTPDRRTKRNLGAAAQFTWYRSATKGDTPVIGGTMIMPGTQIEERLFVQPTRRVTKGEFSVATRWILDAPAVTMKAPGIELDPEYYLPAAFSDFSAEYPRLDGTRLLPAVDAGQGRPEDLKGKDLRGRLALVRRTDGLPVAEQSGNAAAAGAAMVAVYNDRPGVDPSPGGFGTRLTVPTVRLPGEQGRALLDRLRRAPVPVLAGGTVASPYLYDVLLRERGRVRDDLTYVLRDRELAREDVEFRTQLARDVTVTEGRAPFEPWDTYSFTTPRSVMKAPRTRVTYTVPDPDVRWLNGATTPEYPYNNSRPHPDTFYQELLERDFHVFRPGETRHRTWFGQPTVSGTNPRRPVTRAGDELRVSMRGFVDADRNWGDAYTTAFESGVRSSFRVYQGDTLLAETAYRPDGTVALPAERANYRMEFDVENRSPWARLSTRIGSVWTFTSERPAPGTAAVVPLLLAGYDIELDGQNRGAPAAIGLRLYRQDGSPAAGVTDVSLEVSGDDGATWRPVRRLTATGKGAYTARLDRVESGFVSLRLRAGDAGGTLTQEVIRAYATR